MGKLLFCIIICIGSFIYVCRKKMENQFHVYLIFLNILSLGVFLTLTLGLVFQMFDAKNDTKLKDEYAILLKTINSYNENIPFDITLVERVQKFNEDYMEYAENVKNENFWTKGLYTKEAIEGLDVIHIEEYRN